jgi:lactoylglutathione lyase
MKIEHFAIWTRDLESMRAFYETYFGASAGDRYENPNHEFASYFLTFSDGARLELMQMASIKSTGLTPEQQYHGFAHFAVSVGSEATVDALTQRLSDDGYRHLDGPEKQEMDTTNPLCSILKAIAST